MDSERKWRGTVGLNSCLSFDTSMFWFFSWSACLLQEKVCSRANALFSEVSKVLHVKLEKFSVDSSLKAPKISEQIAEMEEILEKEKTEFEVIPCLFSLSCCWDTKLYHLHWRWCMNKFVNLAYWKGCYWWPVWSSTVLKDDYQTNISVFGVDNMFQTFSTFLKNLRVSV